MRRDRCPPLCETTITITDFGKPECTLTGEGDSKRQYNPAECLCTRQPHVSPRFILNKKKERKKKHMYIYIYIFQI